MATLPEGQSRHQTHNDDTSDKLEEVAQSPPQSQSKDESSLVSHSDAPNSTPTPTRTIPTSDLTTSDTLTAPLPVPGQVPIPPPTSRSHNPFDTANLISSLPSAPAPTPGQVPSHGVDAEDATEDELVIISPANERVDFEEEEIDAVLVQVDESTEVEKTAGSTYPFVTTTNPFEDGYEEVSATAPAPAPGQVPTLPVATSSPSPPEPTSAPAQVTAPPSTAPSSVLAATPGPTPTHVPTPPASTAPPSDPNPAPTPALPPATAQIPTLPAQTTPPAFTSTSPPHPIPIAPPSTSLSAPKLMSFTSKPSPSTSSANISNAVAGSSSASSSQRQLAPPPPIQQSTSQQSRLSQHSTSSSSRGRVVDPSVQNSIAEVWYMKEIEFQKERVRIVTQNFNGPCSFIAICNILILRGELTIEPPSRQTVSYEFLSHLVAEVLLMRGGNGDDVSEALSVMPYTQKGMDLNPVFTSHTSFRPQYPSGATVSSSGGGLKLFSEVGITLVHGWLVDPESVEGNAVRKVGDYDTAVGLIVEVDHLTKGRFVGGEDAWGGSSAGIGVAGGSSGTGSMKKGLSDEEERKVGDAILVQQFLDTTQSQLTYHGLFQLATTLVPGRLYALFRNSHLSVLYKNPPSTPGGDDSYLYTLVTDQVFLNEPSVVWERLEDVDGGSSSFVDGEFKRSSPAGGDFAGQTAEQALMVHEQMQGNGNTDYALAMHLQDEEDRRAQLNYARHEQDKQTKLKEAREREERERERKKKEKKDCIIM